MASLPPDSISQFIIQLLSAELLLICLSVMFISVSECAGSSSRYIFFYSALLFFPSVALYLPSSSVFVFCLSSSFWFYLHARSMMVRVPTSDCPWGFILHLPSLSLSCCYFYIAFFPLLSLVWLFIQLTVLIDCLITSFPTALFPPISSPLYFRLLFR